MFEVAHPVENELTEDFLNESALVEEIDYSSYGKEDFGKLLDKYAKDVEVQEQYSVFKKVKPFIDDLAEGEKNAALDRFLADGGIADDFDYRSEPFFEKFEKAFQQARNNFLQQQKDTQAKKEANLKTKNEILAQMRALVDGPDSKATFENFKKLQQDWKNTGPVPADQAQTLWANYHALVNRFYDHRSIAFELKELDRKRNLQAKLHICEKAEKLTEESSIKKSLKELEELHEEFRHIGPVPKEQQEEIWNRLKEASNKIHDKKKVYLDDLKSKYDQNLLIKTGLIEKLNAFASFTTDRADEWMSKTKEIEVIQNEWKSAGLIDKEKVKEINKHYWDNLKRFYNAKRAFFKELERVKNENLRLKTELCEKAETLALDTDWENTTKEIIELQKQWKTIGHVPLKLKDKIYERFKKACDSFFDSRRSSQKENQNAAKVQVRQRFEFCEKIEKAGADEFASVEDVNKIIEEWGTLPEATGHEAARAYNRFVDAVKSKLKGVTDIDEIEKDNMVTRLMVDALKSTPDGEKELILKEKKLRKDIRDIEDNIAQFKNNMEFFARAKNADAIRKEFTGKIEEEEHKMAVAKARLRVLLGK